MIFHFHFLNSGRRLVRTASGGFTVPEVLVAMTIFVLLVSTIVISHLFGLRMFQITGTKINATENARKAVGRITDEIHSSKDTKIGNVTNGVFAALLDGERQQGSALLISPTTNTTNYIIYFVNPSDKTLRRTASKSTISMVQAESIANSMVFQAQDFSGEVLTNDRNNRVIHFSIEFYQPEGFMRIADNYKLETAVTRRAE